MRLILRLFWVAIAAVVSAVAGVAGASAILLERLTVAAPRGANGALDPLDIMERAHPFLDQTTAALWSLSLLPPLGLLIIGEVARLRSLTFYVAGGGAAAAALPGLSALSVSRAGTAPYPVLLIETLAVAGFIAGAVYWGLAGRRA